jgi:hypothetical protein
MVSKSQKNCLSRKANLDPIQGRDEKTDTWCGKYKSFRISVNAAYSDFKLTGYGNQYL